MTGVTAGGAFEAAFLGVLGIAAWQDRKSLSISGKFLFAAGILAVLGRILVEDRGQDTAAEWGLSLLPGLFLLLAGRLSRWQIGAGDGAVILIMGLWLGFEKTIVVLTMGLFLCSIFCGGLVLLKKAGRKTEIPFIPFLLAACLIGRAAG